MCRRLEGIASRDQSANQRMIDMLAACLADRAIVQYAYDLAMCVVMILGPAQLKRETECMIQGQFEQDMCIEWWV